jgi:hypothetical protein
MVEVLAVRQEAEGMRGTLTQRARSVSLMRYCLMTTEHFQRFARRTRTTLLQVLGLGVLHNRFCLAMNWKN